MITYTIKLTFHDPHLSATELTGAISYLFKDGWLIVNQSASETRLRESSISRIEIKTVSEDPLTERVKAASKAYHGPGLEPLDVGDLAWLQMELRKQKDAGTQARKNSQELRDKLDVALMNERKLEDRIAALTQENYHLQNGLNDEVALTDDLAIELAELKAEKANALKLKINLLDAGGAEAVYFNGEYASYVDPIELAGVRFMLNFLKNKGIIA